MGDWSRLSRESLAKRNSQLTGTSLLPTTCSFYAMVASLMNIEARTKYFRHFEEIQVKTCRNKLLK